MVHRAASHRVGWGAAVALFFGLALTWGLMRFGAAETATLYRLFLFLLIPTLATLLPPPRRQATDLRLLGVGLLGVLLLGLVVLQPTLESRGSVHLAVGWSALWLSLWLSNESIKQRQFLIVVLVLLGALEAFYGLIQAIGGVDSIGDYFRHQGRIATGSLINRNHFAALLNMLLPMALGLLFAARARKGQRPADRSESLAKTWIVLLGCSVIGVAVLLSQSRGGTLSLVATLLFMAFLLSMSRRKVSRSGLSAVAALVLLLLVAGMATAFGLEAMVERFGRLDESVSRAEVYADTLTMIGDSPLVGVGPGMYRWTFRTYQTAQPNRLYEHAHNDYLETAAEWGVPLAVLAWSFVLWRFFRSSLRFLTVKDPQLRGLALGTAGALFSILIHSLVDFSLQVPAILMVFACVVALSWSLDLEDARATVRTLWLKALLIATLLLSGWVVLQRARAEERARPEQGVAGLEDAVLIDREAPEHHFLLGMAYRDLPGTGDPVSAMAQLRTAVSLNPYAWRYWMELSRMQELMGEMGAAEESLRTAVRLNRSSGAYRWRLANLLFRQGAVERAVDELIETVRLEPHLAEPAVALLLKLGSDESVIRQLLPTDRLALLRLLQAMLSLDERVTSVPSGTSMPVARLLEEIWLRLLAPPEPVTFVEGRAYVSRLFGAGEPARARQAWIDLARVNGISDLEYEQGQNHVWNGGFELEPMGSPLGWQIGRSEAFSARRSMEAGPDGTAALEIEFHGEENLDFAEVYQALVLRPGATYELSFRMRGEDLSTDQGVFVEVFSRQPHRILVSTEPFLGTSEWSPVGAEFVAPEGGGRAWIRLRRRASQRLDNRLRGKVWLDGVTIERVQELEVFDESDEQQ